MSRGWTIALLAIPAGICGSVAGALVFGFYAFLSEPGANIDPFLAAMAPAFFGMFVTIPAALLLGAPTISALMSRLPRQPGRITLYATLAGALAGGVLIALFLGWPDKGVYFALVASGAAYGAFTAFFHVRLALRALRLAPDQFLQNE